MIVGKFAHWKTAASDLVSGFYFQKLTDLHEDLQQHLQKCLDQNMAPECMVQERRNYILKEPKKKDRQTIKGLLLLTIYAEMFDRNTQ